MNRDNEQNLSTELEAAEQELLSRKLREAREYLGISQELVAEHLGIPRAAVSAIETGKRKVSSLELKGLAKLYRRPYEFFLEPEESRDSGREDEVGAALFRATKGLSELDREQVLRFAQFLQHAGSPPTAKLMPGEE